LLAARPLAAGQMLVALDFYLGPVQEFAVVGEPAAETQRVLRAIFQCFRPNKAVALKRPDDAAAEELIPLLAGRDYRGQTTTYISETFTCGAPLVGAAALEHSLSR